MNSPSKSILSAAVVAVASSSQLFASSVFVVDDINGNGTATANSAEVNFTLSNTMSSQITDLYLLNDTDNGHTFSRQANGFADLNPNNFDDLQARISFSNVIASGANPSLSFQGVGTNGNNGGGNPGASTWSLTPSGGITSFTLQIDYLNSTGQPLGFASAPDSPTSAATPIASVINSAGTNATVDFSLLAMGFLVNTDFIVGPTNGAGVSNVYMAGDTVGSGGVVSSALGNLEAFNIQSFDNDGGVANHDNSNDLFSSIVLEFNADSGDFDGSRFTLSLDSTVLEEVISVPEPSAFLLAALSGLVFFSRKRR